MSIMPVDNNVNNIFKNSVDKMYQIWYLLSVYVLKTSENYADQNTNL